MCWAEANDGGTVARLMKDEGTGARDDTVGANAHTDWGSTEAALKWQSKTEQQRSALRMKILISLQGVRRHAPNNTIYWASAARLCDDRRLDDEVGRALRGKERE